MSLEGTLATFSIPDVLQLLAATKKSGMLAVTGDNGNGELWLDGGAVVAASATGETSSSDPVAVLMGLLRLEDGSFAFNDGAAADDPGDPQEVAPLLEAATALAAEWAELEAVVPSSDAWVTLAADLAEDEVTLSSEDWSRVVAIAGGVTAAELATTFDVDAIATARWVKGLVARSLVEVAPEAPEGARGAGAAAAAPVASPQPEEAKADPTPVWEPVVIEDDVTAVDDDVAPEVEDDSAPPVAESEPQETSWAPLGGVEVESTPDVVEEAEPTSALAAMESGADFDPSALLREMGMGSGGDDDDDDNNKSSADDGFLPAADGGLGGLSGGEMDINPSDAAEMARQLADLSPEAAKAVAAAAKATSDADLQRALDEVVALDSSINRDLLVKFLGSVNS